MTEPTGAPSSRRDWTACTDKAARDDWADGLSQPEARAEVFKWRTFARPDQWPPDGDWTTWLFLGGRGAGKTRAGAEWVRALALGGIKPPVGRIALVGESHADVREVMVAGESGLIAIHAPGEHPE
jgi:phage terminase large subunit-like protein